MDDLLTFRVVTRQDLPRILDLYARALDGKALAVDDAEKLFERIRSYPDYQLHLCEHDGRLAGTFALLIMDNLGECGTPSGVVEDVVVEPEFQRRGVGRAMMEHALGICRQKGCYKMMLSSNLRRTGAHAFYESLGFEKHGYSFRIDPEQD
ncbi:MAG: GNAT family N-acetyltransferase [Sedimenticolaceae bacterium]|nr:GNAT family N-acetyltransferase [Sedimenticolaceae bacterium]